MKHRILKCSLSEFLELLRDEGEAVYCMLRMLFTYASNAFVELPNSQILINNNNMHCHIHYEEFWKYPTFYQYLKPRRSRENYFYSSRMNSDVSDFTTIRCYKIMAGAKKDHHLICDPKKEQRFHFVEAYKFHFNKTSKSTLRQGLSILFQLNYNSNLGNLVHR